MDREQILAEIKKTTKKNNNLPLGIKKFSKLTGITEYQIGKFWLKWSEAVAEAGIKPNEMKSFVYKDKFLLEALIGFIRELKKYPTDSEIKMKSHNSKDFPFYQRFYKRFGKKAEILQKLLEFCSKKPEYKDIVKICKSELNIINPVPEIKVNKGNSNSSTPKPGEVYLMKSGKFYKIGLSRDTNLRQQKLKIQLPEPIKLIHKIMTDDIFGIENYWHKRFKENRKNGEWFELSKEDIKAFKQRKFM